MSYEITSYVDGIANGDPVIVYSAETNAQSLGTGFTSFEDVRHEIERRFDVEEGQQFDVFGIDGHIEFDEE